MYSSTKYIFFGCFCLPNRSPIKIRGNQWIQWKKCVRWKKCVYSHQWENVFEKKVVAFVMTCGSIIHMVWCNDTDERNFIDKEKNFINEEKMRFRRKLWQIWSSCNQSQTLTVKKKRKKLKEISFPPREMRSFSIQLQIKLFCVCFHSLILWIQLIILVFVIMKISFFCCAYLTNVHCAPHCTVRLP